eukprot:CAMPEP_0194279818 /NCGR_PEP_ID=MMETSP0169-20130528/14140_1 /TAXON_ID=218684 /ORGANISM="Corethron pennatum, Strain L29A3" /LENGTH=346 /DNA_ID=CAMNT_0039024287 /DNA_START=124 /DNA_END=1164 /DNA_ORIENTATION=-
MTAVNIELKPEADLPSTQDNDTTAAEKISSISAFLETSIESLCGNTVCTSISEKANSMFSIPNFYDIVQPLVENEAREEEKVQEVIAESRVVPKEGNNDNEQQEKSTKMIPTDPDPTCAPVIEETTVSGGVPEAVAAVEDVPKTTPAVEEVPAPITVADEAVGTAPPTEDIPAVEEVPQTTKTVEEVPVSVPVADEAAGTGSPTEVLVDKETLPVAPGSDVLTPDSTQDKMPIPETVEEAPATTTEVCVKKTEEGSASDPEHDPIAPPIPMKTNAIDETKVDVAVVEEDSTPPTTKEATVPGVVIEETPVAIPAAEDAAISVTVTEKTPSAALATEKVSVPLPSAE